MTSVNSYPVTLGLEEEFFALEAGLNRPTLQSMDYLRRFAWSHPGRYMTHSASNFAKGEDRKECFMGSIELSTGKHDSAESLVGDLKQRRTDFARAARTALIIPSGTLYHLSSPSNTSCSHIHVGVPPSERHRAYRNLAYFTPVLATAAANSPFEGGKPFGLSSRMAREGLLGPLKEDIEYRFQDLIISKRLGTIEMRVFDPIPELDRLEAILNAIQKIAAWNGEAPFNRDEYNRIRPDWTKNGLTPDVEKRWQEFQEITDFSHHWIEQPFSSIAGKLAEDESIEAAYRMLDQTWRGPTGIESDPRPYSAVKAGLGMTLYYALRMPFIAYKGYMEWYGKRAGR